MVEIKELHGIEAITDALKSIGDSLFDQTVNRPEVLQALGKKYAEKAKVITISSDSELVGLCAYYDNVPQSAFISMLVINSRYQKCGHGTKLLHEVIQRCREKKIPFLRLEVAEDNRKAMELYIQNGFRFLYEIQGRITLQLELSCLQSKEGGNDDRN